MKTNNLNYTTTEINQNFRIKVYGVDANGVIAGIEKVLERK